MGTPLAWKTNWEQTQRRLAAWAQGKDLAVNLTALRGTPHQQLAYPQRPAELLTAWLDPVYRVAEAEYGLAQREYLAEGFPVMETLLGPGSLSTFLGSRPEFSEDTVWYYPCISDPDTYGPIRFLPENNPWLDRHLAIIDQAVARANGRYLVAFPDLIENLDVLASLRGDTPLLFDLIERPEWVSERIAEINLAYFAAYDLIYDRIRAADGSCVFAAFGLWGTGKTAKVQCDISASLSPRMFRRFVVPALAEQCAWLDTAMYHLDGTTCHQHLDALLEIEALDAIEWTPQAGRPTGGSPEWYALYRRIKAAGKAVQVIDVADEELIPLLDAIGPQGTYVLMRGLPRTLDEGEALVKALEPYYAQ